jgi:prepilin-type N-terminal cleavage/methylation domain-containing protein
VGRCGFTLIELLIALVLLDVGLLALVGLGATLTRDADAARRSALALRVASARLERMASLPCLATVNGIAQPAPGLAEWYSDTPAPNGTRMLHDSVAVRQPTGSRSVVVSTRAAC